MKLKDPLTPPIQFTKGEREVLLRILYRSPTPNEGYREFMSAIKKLVGEVKEEKP